MANKPKILLVDDEVSLTEVLRALLRREGYQVRICHNGQDALEYLQNDKFEAMLSDIHMHPIDGIELLQKAKRVQPNMSVVMMTAYATVDSAMEAVKMGAFDYVCKPFKVDELLLILKRAKEHSRKLLASQELTESSTSQKHFNLLIGESSAMQSLYVDLPKLAAAKGTVLIEGESGTGKELVAKALHDLSPRKNQRFVAINCGAVAENLLESELFGHVRGAFTGAIKNKRGLFEEADGGTLFLDEIGTIPLSMQTTLLRVLQEQEIRQVGGNKNISIDVRIIAATNENLEDKIRAGTLREDLFYRISVIPLQLPPLVERDGDVALLVNHFIAIHNEERKANISINSEALTALELYKWPGNVRELENILQRSIALCTKEIITIKDLPLSLLDGKKQIVIEDDKSEEDREFAEFAGTTLKSYLRKKERGYIRYILKQCDGSKEKASEKLGVSLATFYRKYNDI